MNRGNFTWGGAEGAIAARSKNCLEEKPRHRVRKKNIAQAWEYHGTPVSIYRRQINGGGRENTLTPNQGGTRGPNGLREVRGRIAIYEPLIRGESFRVHSKEKG